MAEIPRVTGVDQATKQTVNRSAGARPAVYRRLPTGGSLVGALVGGGSYKMRDSRSAKPRTIDRQSRGQLDEIKMTETGPD
jgi:hypothetical protein